MIRYDLIPNIGVEEVHKVLSKKLEDHKINEWKYGLPWSNVLSHLKKHLLDFELGKDYDENQLLSIASVAMDALILAEYFSIYPQGDDRLLEPVNQPVVSLDVDDVCLDFIGAFEKRFNCKLNPYWDGSYDMSDKLDELSKDKDFWINIPTLHKPTFEPNCYITSRSIPIEWTQECLEKNGFPCAPVYSVPWNTSKVELLKQHNITVHIDDKIKNYQEAISAGIFCYLMDAPHNKYYNVGHRRIYDLNLKLK